jgi:putative ABC transport system permease protein
MFKNYLKIALRNIRRYKGYSFINIAGLAIGMTCCLLIMLYVNQELRYDRFHKNAHRIYRVAMESTTPEGKNRTAASMFPLAPAFKMDYPEVEQMARILFWSSNSLIKSGDKTFFEKRFVFADNELFDIFTFPVIKGKKDNPLADKSSIVITKSIAEKYFGKENPIGKILQYDNRYNFQVTAVIDDIPVNSHFHFDFAAPISVVDKDMIDFDFNTWSGVFGTYTYMLLPENISPGSLENKAKDFVTRHGGKDPGIEWRVFFQRLTDIHLYSHMDGEIETNNFVANLIIISIIGLFILIIACINFINLSTARSSRRSKEVGMRKTLGAARSQLILQYIGESVVFSVLGMGLSLLMIEMSLPYFSILVGKKISFSLAGNIEALLIIVGMILIVGVVSGIYPALVLSGQKMVTTLKGRWGSEKNKKGPMALRKILVTFQFSISIILIIGTMIVLQQLNFFRQADLGFKKEHTVVIPIYDEEVQKKYETVKQEFMRNPDVLAVTACLKPPIGNNYIRTGANPLDKGREARVNVDLNTIDFDFIDYFGLEIIAGRKFSKKISSDKNNAFIINETTVKRLGLASPDEAIGKKLRIGLNRREGTVIGVTRDFHISSLYKNIESLVMLYCPNNIYTMAVKIKSANIRRTISKLKETRLKFSKKYPFKFSFLDEDINRLYAAEEQTSRIIGTFAGIAIFIACMGLFGMASFTAEHRKKEIGVRKVLGASVHSIVILLSREFSRWVLLANIIAWPIAYYTMSRWLRNFAYRVDIGLWIFLSAGVIALAIALITVSSQAIKAAFSNPVDVLKNE